MAIAGADFGVDGSEWRCGFDACSAAKFVFPIEALRVAGQTHLGIRNQGYPSEAGRDNALFNVSHADHVLVLNRLVVPAGKWARNESVGDLASLPAAGGGE